MVVGNGSVFGGGPREDFYDEVKGRGSDSAHFQRANLKFSFFILDDDRQVQTEGSI